MDFGDNAADRHARTSADDRGILLCAVVYRNSVPHLEVGLSHRATAFRARRSGVAVFGVVPDRGLADVVRMSPGARVSGPELRGNLRALGMEGGVGGSP